MKELTHLYRLLLLGVLLLIPAVFLRAKGCPGNTALRVATYNIRQLGPATDLERLTGVVAALDADIIAVQEIKDAAAFDALSGRLSRGGRQYRQTLAACGVENRMYVGFLYDRARVELRSTREFAELDPAGKGRCSEGERSGLLGVFAQGPRTVHLLTVHLPAGGTEDQVWRRREQWRRALLIVQQLRREGARQVALLGDVNSIGYLDNRDGERESIDNDARRAGLEVATAALWCSYYWKAPLEPSVLAPNLLDHVVTTPGLARGGSVRVQGFCAALQCQPHPAADEPAEFARVSDHCPVLVEM